HLLGRLGARQVVGVDLLPWRLEWARRFGATDVVDASAADPVEAVRELTSGEMVDLSVEAVGYPEPLDTAARLIRPFGTLLVFGVPRFKTPAFPVDHVFRLEGQIVTSVGARCVDLFADAVHMILAGQVDLAPMVTPRLPFAEATRAFEMYAAREEGTLKLVLEL
ncbi:MAG: zinc-binding dehydrogenase, partial [Planctomycetota bacterium]